MYGVNCSECANNCCGASPVKPPVLLPKEIANFPESDLFVSEGVTRIRRGADEMCVYLGADSRCTVYDKRPLECRLYPWVMQFDGSKVYLVLDKGCEQHDRVDPYDPAAAEFWQVFSHLKPAAESQRLA